ncbi:hypothetical protein CBS14141_000042 [Malassezia furfur]|nr:hypothetical protein CBS14141_000042 [Malassezia furfur]
MRTDPGSSLIAVGAVLIGYFGAVGEEPHSLHELLELYTRPPFVAFAMLYLLVFVSILTMAHLTEWQLLWQPNLQQQRGRMRRRWRSLARRRRSTPALATVAEVSENSSGIATPNPATALNSERTKLLIDTLAADLNAGKSMHGTLADASRTASPSERQPSYGAIPRERRAPLKRANSTPAAPLRDVEADAQKPAMPSVFSLPENRPTVLALAVAYSATSGTLSGVCLLLAKSGVDLLVLTVRGNNQLSSPLSWMLISILLAAALLQLWYLNKSLKLADPVLVCPLAFCFYNISSITLGLMYFNELEQLSWTDVACICMGTALLLCGVWVISLHRSPYKGDEMGEEEDTTLWGPGWHDPAAWHEHDAIIEGAAVTPLAGPMYSGALEAERASPRASGSSHITPHIARNAPLAPHLLPRPRRSVSLPFGTERPTISLDHALNEGIRSPDRAHINAMHRPTLYGILVERGLSIGISPSSPGFHVSSPRRTSNTLHAPPDTPSSHRRH